MQANLASVVQGLAALLAQGLSDCVPADVLGVDPGAIIDALGLKQKLTPSRNNGFLNMFRLMQQKAAQLSGQVHTCIRLRLSTHNSLGHELGLTTPTDAVPVNHEAHVRAEWRGC